MSSNEEKVSVVYPIYGDFDMERLLVSAESALTQDINNEIIVSEEGPEKRFDKEKLSYGDAEVKHVFNHFIPPNDSSNYNTGEIRNKGVIRSEGNYIFSNDADIVMVNPDFLENLVDLKKEEEKVLYRPPMRRLPKEEFELFHEKVKDKGLREVLENDLDWSQDYIATLNARDWAIETSSKDGEKFPYRKTFTAYKEDFEKYINNPELEGKEPMFWNETRYCGGIFFEKEEFMEVGGYCEKFINWGCEDSDLQYKFGEKFGISLIPYEEDYEVLHLDHPKDYFRAEMWDRNEKIEEERRNRDIEEVIKEDMKKDHV